MCTTNHQRGFTLIELIMVIVLMGIIAGMVTVFMKSPIDAYIASGRRAAMTDTADTVVRRIARDVQRALPNSIRTSVDLHCLEFIPTKTGGRYRTAGAGALDFTTNAPGFNMLASKTDFAGVANAIPVEQRIGTDDLIVIYNLGIPGADAYNSDNNSKNWTPVTSVGTESGSETPIIMTPFKFPLESGSNRFQVVDAGEQMVSYVCSGTNLLRAKSTAMTASASCPTANTSTATVSIMASNVDCTPSPNAKTWFNYSGSDLMRNALVSMALTLKDSSGESVTLQHEVHVSNTP